MKTRLVTFDTHFFLRFIFEQLDIVLSQKSSTLCRHNEPRAHWLGLLSPCYCHADRVAGDKLCCQSAGLKYKNHHPYRAGACEHRLYSQTSSSRSITLSCSNTDTRCAAVRGAKSPQFERAVCEQVYTRLKKKSTGGPQSSWMKSATSSQELPTLFICLKWRVCTWKIPITTNKVPQTRVTH